MAFLSGVLFVLLTLTAKGYSLSCQLCVPSMLEKCTGINVVCPTDYACATTYTETTINGSTTPVFTRTCLPQSQCNVTGSITIPGGTAKTSVSCCFADNCIPQTPQIPQTASSNVTNGVTCQTCLTVNSDWCYTSSTMQCTGNETMCALQSSKVSDSSEDRQYVVAVRGCATPRMCNLGSQSFSSNQFNSKISYTCTSGSICRRGDFLTALAAILFLLKTLL